MKITALLSTLTLALLCTSALHAQTYSADRPEVKSFINELSARENIPAEQIEALLNRASPVPRVIDYIKPPAQPSVRSWSRYRPRYIDNIRINAGVAFWKANKVAIQTASAQYGVPPEIIVSIIGIETIYGRNTGNFTVFNALATLAFDYPPRAELFRKELGALIVLARHEHQDPYFYKGSYAGAIGLPQFLPSSILNFAVDYDSDGKIDLQNSPTDAIGSVANFLLQHGWKRGEPVITRARIEPGADISALVAADITPQFGTQALAQNGVFAADASLPDLPAALIELTSPDQPTEHWLGYQNFYTITRYNRSSFYAMVVAQLAEAVKQAAIIDQAKEIARGRTKGKK